MSLAEGLQEQIEIFCPEWNDERKKSFLRLLFYEFYFELHHSVLNNNDEKITQRKLIELIHELKNYL